MCEIEVLDNPSEEENTRLRNRVISKHRKKKFLAKFDKYDHLIYLHFYPTNENPKLLTIIDDPDDFIEKVNSDEKFIKIRTIKTKLQVRKTAMHTNFLSIPYWEDGLSDYQEGIPTRYSTFEIYINKDQLKDFFVGKSIKKQPSKKMTADIDEKKLTNSLSEHAKRLANSVRHGLQENK